MNIDNNTKPRPNTTSPNLKNALSLSSRFCPILFDSHPNNKILNILLMAILLVYKILHHDDDIMFHAIPE